MGVEDEIRELIRQGYRRQDIVRQGYKKSTVYKVHNSFVANIAPISPSRWGVTWTPPKRYMPGEIVAFDYSVKNTSNLDFYIYRTGLQPEWLQGEWYVQEVRNLLRPGESMSLLLNASVPADLPLGEYDMRWGVDGQHVGPGTTTLGHQLVTEWTEPFVLEVKKPLTGYNVFISHSTKDMRLVRQLEEFLDNEGIKAVIAEDAKEPGVVLSEKFENKIADSHFFLALFTEHGVRSEWVISETNYAIKIRKPTILLKEREVNLESSIEWVEFSRYDQTEYILQIVAEALENVRKRSLVLPLPPVPPLGVIALGALAFLFGLAAGRSENND